MAAKNKPKKQKDTPTTNGPWTEITNGIKAAVRPVDEVLMEEPALKWVLPISLATELYDSAMRANTRLTADQLQTVRRRFGENSTLSDIKLWLQKQNLHIRRLGWLDVVKLIEQEEAAKPPAVRATQIEEQTIFSPKQLAEQFSLPLERLRKRLARLRKRDHNSFIEVMDRGPKEPQFLYRIESVRTIIDSMKASSETSSERPA